MKKTRRKMQTGSLSFLDVICCGFGTMVLLLVLVKIFEPIRLEEELERIRAEYLATRDEAELSDEVQNELVVARQRLTDEMQRYRRVASLARVLQLQSTGGDTGGDRHLP